MIKLVSQALSLCLITITLQVNAGSQFHKNKTFHPGFYGFYHDNAEGKIYLEISQFNQPFIFQSSLPYGIGSNDIGYDRGQLGETRLVQFERVGNKVFLRQLNTRYRASSNNPLEHQSIKEAFASSIIWGFTVSSESNNKTIIDYTDFLLSDIHNIASDLEEAEQGSYAIDQSRSAISIKRSKAFPNNTEFESTVTYKGNTTSEHLMSVTPDSKAITVNLHHSLIALPDKQYQAREFHPYSGYWDERHMDYSAEIDQPITKRVITRHRLKKKNPEAKLSEAIEPIVYYLDPGVPEPIKSALIDGALWWNEGFETLGFKNAFQIKILPDYADPMDARYNVIQWVHRATRGWSYGSTITDPRTGEIIKGHVTLGSLRARQDFLIATGLTSPFSTEQANTSEQKAMALARIRQLAAHEVGHTLGIAHNFAASSNDRASVMDYPHPQIDIIDSKISLKNAYAKGLGEWDKHVLAYGYSDFVGDDTNNKLQQIISKAKDKGLRYISDPDARHSSSPHAYAHLWDNGKNATTELIRLLKVRAIALENFGINSIPYNTPLSELEQTLAPIYHLHRYQSQAVASLIGGLNYSYEVKTKKTAIGVTSVSGQEQQEALEALISTLDESVLNIPDKLVKLIPPKAYGYERSRENFDANTGIAFDPVTAAEASAKHTLNLILNSKRLARVQQQAAIDHTTADTAEIIEQLISKTIKQPARKQLGLLIQQRVNTQLVAQLIMLWQDKVTVIEVKADIFKQLLDLQLWLQNNSKRRHSKNDLYAHYRLLYQLIESNLTFNNVIGEPAKIRMPPGSPI